MFAEFAKVPLSWFGILRKPDFCQMSCSKFCEQVFDILHNCSSFWYGEITKPREGALEQALHVGVGKRGFQSSLGRPQNFGACSFPSTPPTGGHLRSSGPPQHCWRKIRSSAFAHILMPKLCCLHKESCGKKQKEEVIDQLGTPKMQDHSTLHCQHNKKHRCGHVCCKAHTRKTPRFGTRSRCCQSTLASKEGMCFWGATQLTKSHLRTKIANTTLS